MSGDHDTLPAGTLDAHLHHVARSAQDCRPATCTEHRAAARMAAVLQALDLLTLTPATRPKAAAPAHQPTPTRLRERGDHHGKPVEPVPMNATVHRHPSATGNGPPGTDRCSGFWRHEWNRVSRLEHPDRCEVVRRAGHYLASLLRRDPDAPAGTWTHDDELKAALVEGAGHPLDVVCRNRPVTPTELARHRADQGRSPLTGDPWTPPTQLAECARVARALKAHGVDSTTAAACLSSPDRKVSAPTVRSWTSGHRRADAQRAAA